MQVVGVGFAESTERRLSVCEFPDDQHFSNLEALVVQLSPKEVLLPTASESALDIAEVKRVRHMFLFLAIKVML
jgi:DNA mismatch repair protein MSH2